jgi:hypothetical protein
MLAVCACIWLSHGLPHRYPVLARMEPANPTLASDKCLVQYDEDRPNLSPPCYAAVSAPTSVAIWGDSHAAALAPGLRALAIAQGYGFVQLTKAACLPLAGVMRYIPRIPAQASRCLNFNRKVFDLIQTDPRIRIVVLAGVWSGCLERNWENGWLIADTSRRPRNSTLTPSLPAIQALHSIAECANPDSARSRQICHWAGTCTWLRLRSPIQSPRRAHPCSECTGHRSWNPQAG